MTRDVRAQLSARWPDWSIFTSDAGHWYAGRRTPRFLAEQGLNLGLCMTVHASGPDELAAGLARQDQLAKQAFATWGTLS